MGHRKVEQEENGKEACYAGSMGNSIVASTRANHGRLRRVLSHSFSSQAMMKQEPIIRKYVDILIRRLNEISVSTQNQNETKPVNVMRWFNYCTFDMVGDLAFGEPFDCLIREDYHPWVALIFNSIKYMAVAIAMRHFPLIYGLLEKCIPRKLREQDEDRRRLSREKVLRRIESGPRHDFTECMVSRKDEQQMSHDEIQENAEVLIIAGSETTATTLTGATFLLATNPACMTRVVEEVRAAFQNEEEINIVNTASRLPYTLAVLDETMRRYPPVAACTPRQTPPGGNMILGEFVPGGTVLGVWHWPMYHSEAHFRRPFDFCPERWLGDPEFVNDRRDAFEPFSFGPRNCLGRK